MGTLPRKHILIVGLAALVFVLIGAIVGLIVTSAGGGRSGSVRNLTLQPNDLPPEFVLADEKLYSREELMAELPAESQVAEAGLREAIHLTYESQEDIPMVVDVFVYVYQDEASAEEAHGYFLQQEAMDVHKLYKLLRRLEGGHDLLALTLSGGLAEGMGDDAFSMTGEMEPDAGSSVPVNIYFMRSASARAEVLVAGESIFLDAQTVARNQYLRLEKPDVVVAPQAP